MNSVRGATVGLVGIVTLAATLIAAEDKTGEFTALCVDRSGVELEVTDFAFNFKYSYPTSGWIGKSSTSEKNPLHVFPLKHHGLLVRIPLADVDVITFADIDPKTSAPSSVQVTMRNGKKLTGAAGSIGYDNRFTGKTELGDFSLAVDKVKLVTIQHDKSKNVKPIKVSLPDRYDSTFKARVKTQDGTEYMMDRVSFFRLWYGWNWQDSATSVKLKVGESENTVPFDKIQKIVMNKKSEAKPWEKTGQYISTSGKSYPVEFMGPNIWFGGVVEEFGACWIELDDIASIEFLR